MPRHAALRTHQLLVVAGLLTIAGCGTTDASELRVVKQEKAGFASKSGIVIPLQYDNAQEFSEGLAAVEIKRKWGYIDASGRYVIVPQFDEAQKFSEGFAAVRFGDRRFHIDKTGKGFIDLTKTLAVNSRQISRISNFSDGLAAVLIGSKWGYVDKDGKLAIPLQFDEAHDFSDGLAAVRGEGFWRYIDKTGRLAIKTPLFPISDFSEGLAAVRAPNGGDWGYIDDTGQLAINLQFGAVRNFSEGLAAVRKGQFGKWRYIDKTGRFAINREFDDARDFSEGLAPVFTERTWGYIDKTGNFVIKPQFVTAEGFSHGLAKVNSGGKLALIDSEGREVWSWAYMELVAQKFIGQINATTPNEALNAWAAARNSHAISSLRTINSAEAEFFKRGRYGSIPELVGASLLTPNFTEVIDSYRFEVNLLAGNSSYQAITRPATAMPGLWDYYSGPDGIVHYSTTVGRAPAGAEGQQP